MKVQKYEKQGDYLYSKIRLSIVSRNWETKEADLRRPLLFYNYSTKIKE